MKRISMWIGLLAFLPTSAAASLYGWRDAAGIWHFSNHHYPAYAKPVTDRHPAPPDHHRNFRPHPPRKKTVEPQNHQPLRLAGHRRKVGKIENRTRPMAAPSETMTTAAEVLPPASVHRSQRRIRRHMQEPVVSRGHRWIDEDTAARMETAVTFSRPSRKTHPSMHMNAWDHIERHYWQNPLVPKSGGRRTHRFERPRRYREKIHRHRMDHADRSRDRRYGSAFRHRR